MQHMVLKNRIHYFQTSAFFVPINGPLTFQKIWTQIMAYLIFYSFDQRVLTGDGVATRSSSVSRPRTATCCAARYWRSTCWVGRAATGALTVGGTATISGKQTLIRIRTLRRG